MPARGQDAGSDSGDSVDDEFTLHEEDDFPDLVRVDDTGGIMDEFSLLEEALSADEVVSASKHRQSIFWSPSAITVMEREEIRASGAASITDLLRRIPGFDVYELKPSNPLVGARALTEDANNLLLLLVDGREAMMEVVGFAYWAGLTIDLSEVERIEVIRGPGSTLYGANAYAGVVNIVTVRERGGSGADISVNAGQQGFQDLFARARGRLPLGPGVLSFSAGAGSIGRVSHEDVRSYLADGWRSHGYLRYQSGEELDLSLHAGIVQGDLLNYFHMGDMWLTGATNLFVMGKAKIQLTKDIRLGVQLYHSRYAAVLLYRFPIRAFDIFVARTPVLDLTTPTVDGQLQLDWQLLENVLLIAGGNLRYTSLSGSGITPADISELRGAGFVHAQWHPWEFLQLTGGLRLDFNSETEAALSPRAVVVFHPWPDHSWRLGYSRAFRKPSFFERNLHLEVVDYNPAFSEIVGKMATEYGNEDLVNEKLHSFEAGWRSRFLDGRLDLSLDLFYNIYQDNIYFLTNVPLRLGMPDIDKASFHYENQGAEIHAMGAEFEVSARPLPELFLWANVHLRRVVDQSSDERLPGEPRLRLNLGAGRRAPAGLQADLSLHYVSAYQMPVNQPLNTLNFPSLKSLGGNTLVIGRVGYGLTIEGVASVECGMQFRVPLGTPFREYAGVDFPDSETGINRSSFGGHPLVPWFLFYLRGSI